MDVTCMKLEHIKMFVAFAYPLKQFVCEPCVNITNVSKHDNKACANHRMSETHILLLHSYIIIGSLEMTHINYHGT